jgi:D-cysteine desulfhydrase family pyridoxal phosphate-dependent enzyme
MINLPRINFAHLPTAIDLAPRLSVELGGPTIYIKRDDQTGVAFGGNKTRKLEFLVGDAQAQGAKMLITAGAVQSNHCRQTAAVAARYGFKCTIVLSGEKPERYTGNLLLDHLFGAEIVWTQRKERYQVFEETFQKAWEDGECPYKIPYGGSNPTGAVAYAIAMQEFLEQLVNLSLPRPDWLVFASSSGGTQAGLVAGAKLFGFDGKILGISVDESSLFLQNRIAVLANQIGELVGETLNIAPEHVLINSDYRGAGYGIMGEVEQEAIQLFAKSEGLLLDPVYTGRAAAGLIDLIKNGTIKPDENVVFWHTGGGPALFAEKYQAQLMTT